MCAWHVLDAVFLELTETEILKNWKEMNQLTETETEKSWKTETELKLKLKSPQKLKLN